MKIILLRALTIAIILGPLTTLVASAIFLHSARKYEPPLSQEELRKMDNLTVKEFEAALNVRAINLTRTQWLAESIHYPYFWKNLAKSTLVPALGIFLACICMGIVGRRNARTEIHHPNCMH